MQEKQISMIRMISKSSKPVPCKQLASCLNISTRTVINYMNDINGMYPEPVIISTPNGYVIDRTRTAGLLDQVNSIPDGYRERSFYICKQLLLGSVKELDAFELSDEMCISYSLLKNDLQKMNQSYAYLNVKFVIKNNNVSVSGTEKDKRKLMNHMLTQSQEANLLDIATLKQFFPQDVVDTIQIILDEVYQKTGYYLNDFSKINMLLHVLIMVVRVINGNTIHMDGGQDLKIDETSDGDYNLADMLCDELQKRFSIEISPADKLQLYFLIKSNSTVLEAKTEESLAGYVGSQLLDHIREIVSGTERRFCIRLDSSEFFVRFALHVNCMRVRSLNHIQIVNPLKTSLRSSSPFLYDIAIYMVQQLRAKNIISSSISEDEISFIVLHIGAEIERQNVTDSTISCVLMIPEYLNMGQTIARKIMRRFSDQITIKQTITLEEPKPDASCDLAISVIDKNNTSGGQCVYISPFLTSADYAGISNAIDKVQIQKSLEYLHRNFDFYFSSGNFIIDRSRRMERDAAIDKLCNLLINNQVVTREYRDNVLKRENAASTAYFDFAIPHSVCMEATINTIGVLVAPGGIQWNEHLVYVVFMMAISPDSLNDFQTLYRILAQILTDTSIITSIRDCESFGAFKKLLLNPGFY